MKRMTGLIAALLTAATLIPMTEAAAEPRSRVSPEYQSALSHKATDMVGIEPSLYRGKWYNPRFEQFRRCIMNRESRGNYRAANSVSSARGAYQYLDNSWRDGLVWMMLHESKKRDDGLDPYIRDLFHRPIHKWNRYWQDRAFWTGFRHGEGAHHWYYAGSPCNALA
jgi:hypothetical protein